MSRDNSDSRKMHSMPELACVAAMNSLNGLLLRRRSQSIWRFSMLRNGFSANGLSCDGEKCPTSVQNPAMGKGDRIHGNGTAPLKPSNAMSV